MLHKLLVLLQLRRANAAEELPPASAALAEQNSIRKVAENFADSGVDRTAAGAANFIRLVEIFLLGLFFSGYFLTGVFVGVVPDEMRVVLLFVELFAA